MVARHDLATDPELLDALLVARRGTAFFGRKLNELPDAEFGEPSLLPGWTRAHVIAHVGYNARAIARLIEWANTGVETPMYESTEARGYEIEYGATLHPIALRNLYEHAAIHLNVEWRDTPQDAWTHEVRTAQGRIVPASETVWMRTREVWIHAVDLGNGARFSDIPESVLSRLLDDVTGAWKTRGTDTDLVLRVDGTSGTDNEYGDVDSAAPTVIRGSLPQVAAWATGRSRDVQSSTGEVPDPPRWL
ncbi:maleylpyruvate isomerase family mycothiol-dependent enzyme [Diaminobutyricimonas sp. TR449]|uniref:maleylpyruvate isomerase family mycothiol-dependent enzyme n=1 Tax=Diaminobutyricimonas sp. TR449 TaxID=2708076 RepID=UPI0014235F2F|nr:maleylpyruvate isomerase family mycothiol-dependent enzyme [Diaminobutyricimonas sp. TR449]